MKIGIIGAGAMGSAIIEGLLNAKPYKEMQVLVCEQDQTRCQEIAQRLSVKGTTNINDLADCQMVILAVKPVAVAPVVAAVKLLPIPIVISIVAGVTIAQLVEGCQKDVVRVMPNTPSLIGEGISAIAYSNGITAETKEVVENIFNALGSTVVVTEELFDAVTAISGCGPAYVYLMMEALIDAGCSQGLSRAVARQLVVSTFLGAAKMLDTFPDHPAVLKDRVTSPGGVTIQALHTMEQRGLRGILWDAVNQATKRSQELSQP